MSSIPLFYTIEGIKKFFSKEGFLETPTPPLVPNPGMEPHLHPFKVESTYKSPHLPKREQLYLHTSPEFFMKKLLSEGLEKIFSLSYCFRDEPNSETHRFQFLMLEWYRSHEHYSKILKDAVALISFVEKYLQEKGISVKNIPPPLHQNVDDLFCEFAHFSILDYLHANELKEILEDRHPALLPKHEKPWPWEDYFHLAFLNLIEPQIRKIPFLIIDEFPAPLAALSTLKKDNPKVCERFEIYLNGIELCNCFNELTNLQEQRERMERDAQLKKEIYNYELPPPQVLYTALEKGLPPSAGIALGVERLLKGLCLDKNISIFSE